MERRNFFKLIIVVVILLSTIIGCTIDGFKKEEIAKIMSKDAGSVFPLLTINDKNDSLILRHIARKISKGDVVSSYMEQLKSRMLKTVTDTTDLYSA